MTFLTSLGIALAPALLVAGVADTTPAMIVLEGSLFAGDPFTGMLIYETGLSDTDARATHGQYEDPTGRLSIFLYGDAYETALGPLHLSTEKRGAASAALRGGATVWVDGLRIESLGNHPVAGVEIRWIRVFNSSQTNSPPNPQVSSDALPPPGLMAALLTGARVEIDLEPGPVLRGDITRAHAIPVPSSAGLVALGIAAAIALRSGRAGTRSLRPCFLKSLVAAIS